MTLSHSGGGAAISARSISISGSVSERRSHCAGKAIAVDGERTAGRQLVTVGRLHHQRAEAAHFGMQEADGAALGIVGSERIGTDQLGELSGLVRGGAAGRSHFVQHHRHAAARELPSGLRAR